jgi:hypothetical protein
MEIPTIPGLDELVYSITHGDPNINGTTAHLFELHGTDISNGP